MILARGRVRAILAKILGCAYWQEGEIGRGNM